MKQNKYDVDGLNALLLAVVEQANEDKAYYPQPRIKKVVDNEGNTVTVSIPVSKKTEREAERIRKDAEDFLTAMRERYAG